MAKGKLTSAPRTSPRTLPATPSFNTTFVGVSVPVGAVITATATDAAGNTSEFSLNRTAINGNTAPVLNPAASPVLAAVIEDAGAPSGAVGTLVSALVDFAIPAGQVDNVTDPDAGALLGIAVTAADTANGTWWYSTNNGSTWNALGAVADNNARLLTADASTRLYFRPNADYNGTLASAITFRAGTRPVAATARWLTPRQTAADSAYSTATDTASLVITAVNDVPVITSDGGGRPQRSASPRTRRPSRRSPPRRRPAGADADLLDQRRRGRGPVHDQRCDGVLRFLAAPNYEAPTDAGANNVYDVTVQVSDGALTDTQAIAVTVTAVNDNSPAITSNGGGATATISIAENTTAVDDRHRHRRRPAGSRR